MKQGKSEIFNKTFTYKQKNNFVIDKLSPFTKYNVSLRLGDVSVYGEAVSIEFTTAEAGKKLPLGMSNIFIVENNDLVYYANCPLDNRLKVDLGKKNKIFYYS